VIQPVSGLPDRWEVDRFLGRGGQADVWLARDRELDEMVAIKIFREAVGPETHRRIQREVGIGRRLVHPRLVRVFELIEAGDRLAVAMEWVPGGSVAQRLEAGELTLAEVVAWGEQALEALAFLHSHQVVHRDVKPSNLLIDAAGAIRLADLGLARTLADGGDASLTAAAVGTPQYMSPEQIRGGRVGPPSDLYSMGVALYQMLTGERPFAGASDFAVARRHLEQVPPAVRRARADCPVWLARFVRRLLEKNPRDRFADASAALKAFREHRVAVRPRLLRRGLLVASILALASLAAYRAVPAVRERFGATTVSVETHDATARGLDAKGRELWRFTAQQPIQEAVRADLDGDGRWEWAVSAYPKSRRRAVSRARSEIAILSHRGALVHRLQPESLMPSWNHSTLLAFNPQLRPVDVDGDGGSELIAVLISRDSYLSVLAIYWPRESHWDAIAVNSGYIEDLLAIPGPSPQLRLLAFNSNLGMVHAVGQVSFNRSGSADLRTHGAVTRSPDAAALVSQERYRLDWYVPLPQPGRSLSQPDLSTGEYSGETRLRIGEQTTVIDNLQNVVPGPNQGRNLTRLRREYFADRLQLFAGPTRLTVAEVEGLYAALQRTYQPLLSEVPYRVALAEAASLAFYERGAHARAIEVLEAAVDSSGYESASYRLALLEGFRGNLDRATALLLRVASTSQTPAGDYRARQALRFISVELGEDLLNNAQFHSSAESEFGIRAAYDARTRLWRDSCRPADATVESWDYVPEGDAVACLVRWRTGTLRPDDEARMADFQRGNPDMAITATVARAAALLGAHRATEAVLLLEGLPPRVDLQEPDAYMLDRFRILGAALRVKALDLAGERALAATDGRRLRVSLRDGLLPAILVDEVLHGGS